MCGAVDLLRRDRKSRALLVHLCSFGGSQDPIASATCFQSAPNSLDHGAYTEAGPVILAVWCSSVFLPGLSPCCLFGSPFLATHCCIAFYNWVFFTLDDAARMCTDIPSTEVSAWTNGAQHPLSSCPSLWL
jgi:hypothetical protein